MKTIETYIISCLQRGNYKEEDIDYFLQCQSCSGSAQEKIGLKILEAEFSQKPTWVIWFGNGFSLPFIEKARLFPRRGNYMGLVSVQDFCDKALKGQLQ